MSRQSGVSRTFEEAAGTQFCQVLSENCAPESLQDIYAQPMVFHAEGRPLLGLLSSLYVSRSPRQRNENVEGIDLATVRLHDVSMAAAGEFRELGQGS